MLVIPLTERSRRGGGGASPSVVAARCCVQSSAGMATCCRPLLGAHEPGWSSDVLFPPSQARGCSRLAVCPVSRIHRPAGLLVQGKKGEHEAADHRTGNPELNLQSSQRTMATIIHSQDITLRGETRLISARSSLMVGTSVAARFHLSSATGLATTRTRASRCVGNHCLLCGTARPSIPATSGVDRTLCPRLEAWPGQGPVRLEEEAQRTTARWLLRATGG